MTNTSAGDGTQPSRLGPRVKFAVKLVLTALILFAVGRHVLRTWGELKARGVALNPAPGRLLLSGGLYLAGLSACGLYYGRILNAEAPGTRYLPALRAYLLSHLGKYVPGKALVVVMRVALTTPYGPSAAASGFATFYETLVMMASGGLLAGLGFLAVQASEAEVAIGGISAPFWLLGLGMGLGFLAVVVPRVFRAAGRFATMPFPGVEAGDVPSYSSRLLVEGLLLSSAGWIFLGLSQAVLMPVVGATDRIGMNLAIVSVASVALATVAGFAVPVSPGGLGVREFVLWSAMSAAVSEDQAVLAAVLLRLVWLAAELVAATVCLALRIRPDSERRTEPC